MAMSCPHCGSMTGQHKADCLLTRQFHGEMPIGDGPHDALPIRFDTTLETTVNQRLHDMGFYRTHKQPLWIIGTIEKTVDGDMGVCHIDRLLEQVPDYAHRSCKPQARWHGEAISVVGKDVAEAELLAQIVVKALLESGS